MQLTKGDVLESGTYRPSLHRAVLDYSKFQQVRKFYDDYKYYEAMLRDKEKKAWASWLKSDEFKIYKKEIENKNYVVAEEWYADWLFSYCFKDGLK